MKKLSLDEMKQLELNLLLQYADVCKKNNLYYVLCGGTLIGAIRHKGFIPWDDDIDVLMPRPDYDRLMDHIDEINETLPEEYRFICWKNGSMNYPFIKLVHTKTKIDVDYFTDLGVNNIWIDIFPIDGNPDDRKELVKIQRKSLFYRKILTLKMAKVGEGKTALKRVLKPFLKAAVCGFSFPWLCAKIDRIAKTYPFDSCSRIGDIVWGYGVRECTDKKGFMTPVEVSFEGYKFQAPSNYDRFLRGIYKDYMTLPPEEKRVIHGIDAYLLEDGDKE